MITDLSTLYAISNEIKKNASNSNDLGDMEIVFKVKSLDVLKKINEDFFYRLNTEGEIDNDITSITLNINGLTFKYVVDDTGD